MSVHGTKNRKEQRGMNAIVVSIPRESSTSELAPVMYERPDLNPAAVYLANLTSNASRRTMESGLRKIADIMTGGRCDIYSMPWHLLRSTHTGAIRARLIETGASPSTVNRELSALRGVLNAARRIGLMTAEDCLNACDVKPVRSETLPRGRALNAGEIRALFESCADGSPGGTLDAALLAVLYGAGLRRSEAVALNVEDLDIETGELRILAAKGRKDRIAYVTNGALLALKAWLSVRGMEPGPLFCPVNKGGAVDVKHMTSQAIYNRLSRRAKKAGVEAFSPHDLRRTFVGDLLDTGADISIVQRLAGHSNVSTTQRYDRRPERAKQRAAELLHVPYVAA